MNGGKNDSSNPTRFKKDDIGKTYQLKDPTREGFEFEGWYTTSEFDTGTKTTKLTITEDTNYYLHAKWNPTYIWFGSYPQSRVQDYPTIKAIDDKIPDTGEKISDCWVDGVKYRRVKDNATLNFNHYIYPDGYAYFKWERIKWRVLNVEDGDKPGEKKYLVMAAEGIDCMPYYDFNFAGMKWAESNVRSWLNGYDLSANLVTYNYSGEGNNFITTAFSPYEQNAIIKSKVKVIGQGYYNDPITTINTEDKIFIPSYREVTNSVYGFKTNGSAEDISAQLKPTFYSIIMGATVSSNADKTCTWWLRNAGRDMDEFGVVEKDGTKTSYAKMNSEAVAVVPAMYITFNSSDYDYTYKEGSYIGGEDTTINYVLNGGTNAAENPSYYMPGVEITLKDAVKEGCNFIGWYTDEALTEKITSIKRNGGDGPITLYAKFTYLPVDNPFTISDIAQSMSSKAQKIKLADKIKNTDGAKLTYKSNDKKVKVDAKGVVTIPKKYAGTVKITITAGKTDKYLKTSKTVTITVAPAKVKSLKTQRSGKKTGKISWKASKFADGYEVKYSTDKEFAKKKTKTKNVTTKSVKLSGLKAGTVYYVQVRAYKKLSKKKYVYSPAVMKTLKKK